MRCVHTSTSGLLDIADHCNWRVAEVAKSSAGVRKPTTQAATKKLKKKKLSLALANYKDFGAALEEAAAGNPSRKSPTDTARHLPKFRTAASREQLQCVSSAVISSLVNLALLVTTHRTGVENQLVCLLFDICPEDVSYDPASFPGDAPSLGAS